MSADEQQWISADDRAWVRLSDEPGAYMEKAHEAFGRGDRKTAAIDLQRAAAQILLEADRASAPIAEGLRHSADELDQLAQKVQQGKIEVAQELDDGLARAARLLAMHYAERAEVAMRQQHPQDAGHFLRSAGSYLQKLEWSADFLADAEVPQLMEDLGRDILTVSGKLIGGTGYTTDEVSQVLARISQTAERFGKSVAAAGSGREPTPTHKPLKAICMVHPLGDQKVSGTVTFLDQGGRVEVKAELTGLTPGPHGFHIHEYGDCSSPDGASAGGHYNPTAMPHGGPDSPERHVGDLGNIVADETGKAVYKREDHVLQLQGADSIIGRAIIV
ncbi:MAG: superoxide dismutase family protein, partial [Planctomycetes bacterium]|nr:superoxide dismutase family protein [Planctomycetota bacterium]